MRITEITVTKKGRYSIYADGEFFAALHEDVFYAEQITVGCEMQFDKLLELKALSEGKITRDRAFKLLSARSYTAKGLYEKLLKYGEPEICEQTVERMAQLGLINDTEYAYAYARDLYNLRSFSKKRIVMELVQKGIDRELAKEASEQFEEEQEASRVEEILQRRYGDKLLDPKEKNRAFQYLARQGFSYSDIKEALARCAEYLEDEV